MFNSYVILYCNFVAVTVVIAQHTKHIRCMAASIQREFEAEKPCIDNRQLISVLTIQFTNIFYS